MKTPIAMPVVNIHKVLVVQTTITPSLSPSCVLPENLILDPEGLHREKCDDPRRETSNMIVWVRPHGVAYVRPEPFNPETCP
jgi:hypothetical protein